MTSKQKVYKNLFNFSFLKVLICNATIGTGKTKTAFVFQMITITIYLGYLHELSTRKLPLVVYWTAEQLYVIILLGLALYYLKKGNRKQ